MNRATLRPAISLTAAITLLTLLSSNSASAQLLPPIAKTARVQITEGPEVELASSYLTIIRRTTNNPGRSDDHFAVIHYGRDPKNLKEPAKAHMRLNRTRSYTVFRVRVGAVQPQTTYHYKGTP